jgi:alpha-amylase
MAEYAPAVLESFKQLAKTGCVEFLAETYYHSLSCLYSREEFEYQVKKQRDLIKKYFNQEPAVFRNTELIYSNEVARMAEKLGFKGILAEGADSVLGLKSPNYLYSAKELELKLLLKNYRLSDDIAFRFSQKSWNEWPLTPSKYAKWISDVNGSGDIVNLFMDYETFGEHQWAESGIFEFFKQLPSEILKHKDNSFITPSQALELTSREELDVPFYISWADKERDLSAWLSNKLQNESMQELYGLEKEVKATQDIDLIEQWRKMTISDHFYYMSTKNYQDGLIHSYFSVFDTPYDAYVYYMNVLHDFIMKLRAVEKQKGLVVDTLTLKQ